jgi:hypothetical protein
MHRGTLAYRCKREETTAKTAYNAQVGLACGCTREEITAKTAYNAQGGTRLQMLKGGSDKEDIIMTRIHREDTIAILEEGMRGKASYSNDAPGRKWSRRACESTHPTVTMLGR